jgi:hypothetical protein
LLDSDAAGDKAANQDVLVHTLGNNRVLRTKDAYVGAVNKPEIEDMLRETLISVAKSELKWDVAVTASAQSSRPIVDVFAHEVGSDFSKYRLAKGFLRWARGADANSLTADERAQWTKMINTINKALA